MLETKGCKSLSKVVVGGDGQAIGGTLGTAFERLKEELGGLDWVAMMDDKKGGLYLDLAVNHQAVDEDGNKLVGLWRLDSLEASYGAGGYHRGVLHNINTLGLYGGLQAEMSGTRAERTHIGYRLSYNLAYEATRRLNNQRDVFELESVYKQDDTYWQQVEEVRRIYTLVAPDVSYGVREEWRVGGKAVEKVMDVLDESVSREQS